MQIANNIVAKASVAFVALAMALTLLAPVAQAQSNEDLQSQIADLLATIASLQAQIGGSTSGSMSCAYTFTTPMGSGATGVEVMNLQKFLNMDAETRVAASGAGSAGMESTYYGALTAAAVSKFQVKYRSEVLTPLGLVNPTGYFGNSSITKANALCAGGGMTGGDDDEDDSSSEGLNGGESSLEDYDASSGDEDEPAEGEEDVPVMDVEFDVEDGDARISRIDVAFTPVSTPSEDDPWDVFEEVSIWVDGDKIADMDASDEDDWSDDDPSTGDYTLRLSGLDWVVREGDTAEFTVAVSIAGSVDDAGTDASWNIFIPTEGIRAIDGQGINQYTGLTSDTVNFDIIEQGGDDELIVKTSSDDPDATTLTLDDNEKSDWLTVFVFDLDTDDSVNDIEIDTLKTELFFSSSTYNNLVDDVQLVVDGDEYDDVTVSDGAGSNPELTFDLDKDLVIDAGDRVAVELQVKFNALTFTADEGTTVYGAASSTYIEAEGADDLGSSQLSGSATGETHTLRTEGVILDPVSTSETFKENSDATTTDNEGTFTVKFDVTAFENDVWIAKTAASGTTSVGSGVTYQIENSSGATVGSVTSSSAVLTSTAPTDSSKFKVAEGETETFTLSVTFDPASAGYYQLQLYGVNASVGTSGATATQQVALPLEDYETDSLNI